MPMPRPATAGARGPLRKEPAASPSGYRVTARQRFELGMAQAFTGTTTIQAVIDVAVGEFLERLWKAPGFSEALVHAEAEQQRRAGVTTLNDP